MSVTCCRKARFTRIGRGRFWALAVVVSLGAVLSAGPALAEIVTYVGVQGQVEKIDTNNPGKHATSGSAAVTTKAGAITFSVEYMDVEDNTDYGFAASQSDPTYGTVGAARQAAVQRVLDYLGPVLNENGVCDIVFFDSLHGTGSGLFWGGTYFSGSPPLFTSGHAYQHITTGIDPTPGLKDMAFTFYFDWPWYAGTENPGMGEYDLDSALLHAFATGLGMVTLSNSNGESIISSRIMSRWDDLLETGTGLKLWDPVTAVFKGVPSDLTGARDGVRFTGAYVQQILGSKPSVYAPSPFSSTRSLGHWLPGANAVLEPDSSLTPGEVKREFALFEFGALKDIGYANVVTPFAFIRLPIGGWFEQGQRLDLQVAAVGTVGAVTYQWTKDGEDIPAATTTQYLIDALGLYHAGTYTCVLTDEAKAVHETPPTLVQVFPAGSLPTMGIIGLAMVVVACVLAGAFILLRRE